MGIPDYDALLKEKNKNEELLEKNKDKYLETEYILLKNLINFYFENPRYNPKYISKNK